MQASLGAGNERGCRNLRYDAELIDGDSVVQVHQHRSLERIKHLYGSLNSAQRHLARSRSRGREDMGKYDSTLLNTQHHTLLSPQGRMP